MTRLTWPSWRVRPALLRRILGVHDSNTGKVTETPTDYATECVIGPYAEAMIDGEMVRSTDLKVMFKASKLSIIPAGATSVEGDTEQHDEVSVSNGPWLRIIAVSAQGIGPTTDVYVCQARP